MDFSGKTIGFREPSALFRQSSAVVGEGTAIVLRASNLMALLAAMSASFAIPERLAGNASIAQVSSEFPTPITPESYAFGIWSLIYAAQAALYGVYQFAPCANRGLLFVRVGFWPVALSLASVAWTVAFTFRQVEIAAAFIWGMTLCLAIIYVRIHTGDGLSTRAVRLGRTWVEYAFGYVPWSLYASWVLGASLSSVLIAARVAPGSGTPAGVVVLALGAAVSLIVLAWTRDVVFAAVYVWTAVAVAARHQSEVSIWGAAFLLAGTVGACAGATWVLNTLDIFFPRHPANEARQGAGHPAGNKAGTNPRAMASFSNNNLAEP